MATDTLCPVGPFVLSTEERVRAAMTGPPAYVRRLRAIEDLEQAIVRELEACARADAALPAAAADALARLNELIVRHNRYYPIEADLPVHLRTGELLERTGEPWRPRPARSLDELTAIARARAACARTSG
ncbi:MAG TPA: hypothetical protein VE987_19655 [Polyangiaceae bacterium]|nr:hypothetical protein [Polyangiaceae bacterium]